MGQHWAYPVVNARTILIASLSAILVFSKVSHASEADDFDLLNQLETDASGRTTVTGAVLNQLQEGATQALTGAIGIARLSYDRQIRLQQAKTLLNNCNQCPEEGELKANYEKQKAQDDRIRDAVDYTLMKSGANSGVVAFMSMLLDPAGIRANEQRLEENKSRTQFAYCFVLSKGDTIKQKLCSQIITSDYIRQKNLEGFEYCNNETKDKFGREIPSHYDAGLPNPSPAQVFWEKCLGDHQLTGVLNRLVSDTCHIPIGIVESRPLSPSDMVKICNPNPDVPNLADARDMVRQGKIIRAVGGLDSEERAYQLFKKAADLGDPNGMGLAGAALVRGDGVAKDEKGGMQLVQDGLAKQSVDARLEYVKLLLNGEGVQKNPARAQQMLFEAAPMENLLRQSVGGLPLQRPPGQEPPGSTQAELEFVLATILGDQGIAEMLIKDSAKIAGVHPLWSDELGSKIKLDAQSRAALEIRASKRRREIADWLVKHRWTFDATYIYYNYESYPVEDIEVKEAIDEERLAEASMFAQGFDDRTMRGSPPRPDIAQKILARVQSTPKYVERAKAMVAGMSAQSAK
jgi:TPR repeat protein